jgi:hypothetical protein
VGTYSYAAGASVCSGCNDAGPGLSSPCVTLTVVMPMSKADFLPKQALYAASVATAAGVDASAVFVTAVTEVFSARATSESAPSNLSRTDQGAYKEAAASRRLLGASAVKVTTSILGSGVAVPTLSSLNACLATNGLPTGASTADSGPVSIAVAPRGSGAARHSTPGACSLPVAIIGAAALWVWAITGAG